MENVHTTLERWRQSLPTSVSVAGLLARCPVAYKWKAPFRTAVLREVLLWRMHDLASQSVLLADGGQYLGARILLRSAIETLALLIFLNHKIRAVLDASLSFFVFEEVTKQLLLGSKNGKTKYQAVNILTALERADSVHVGIRKMYLDLCESAHPNYDGVLYGYSSTDPNEFETSFGNQWAKNFAQEQEPATAFILAVFEHEYNVECHGLLLKLEEWLRQNDAELEAELHGS